MRAWWLQTMIGASSRDAALPVVEMYWNPSANKLMRTRYGIVAFCSLRRAGRAM